MSINVFPVASVSSGGIQSYAVTVPATNTRYKVVQPLSSGTYEITTSPTSVTANVHFFGSSGLLANVTTSSGSIVVSLASDVTYYVVKIDSTAGASVTVTYRSAAVVGTTLSGTLDTITSTSTYNQTGSVYVLAVGGGGGGGSGSSWSGGYDQAKGGGGGGAGSLGFYVGNLSSPVSVTIGSGASGSDSAGGTTSFGNLVSAGGGSAGGIGYIGYPNSSLLGNSLNNPYQDIKSGTNGNGGLGYVTAGNNASGTGGAGGGSGIGTGGTGGGGGAGPAMTGNIGTGYGAGGGGGGAGFNQSGAGAGGTQGVVYVLRGF